MSLREIGRLFGYDSKSILMYLNVFKLPPEYQEAVWNGEIPIGNIMELETLFNGTGQACPPEILTWLDQRLPQRELHKALNPTLAKFKEAQIEKAQEAVGVIEPEIKLDTPEDYSKAAAALKAKAKQLADELLSPEQRAELEEKKKQDEEGKAQKAEQRHQRKLRRREVRLSRARARGHSFWKFSKGGK